MKTKTIWTDKAKITEIFNKKNTINNFINKVHKVNTESTNVTDEERYLKHLERNRQEFDFLKKQIKKKDFNINDPVSDGRTPLFFCTCNNNLEAVKFLIENGANTEIAEYESNNTPLMASLSLEFNDMSFYLVSKGANIHAKNKNGDIPIHFAAITGNLEMVKFLHSLGSDINQKNYESACNILYCVGNSYYDMFKYFVNFKCNLDVIDQENNHIFDLLIKYNNFNMMDYLYTKSLIDKDYNIALVMAVLLNKNDNAIQLIEKYKVNYKYAYSNKSSAIHYAIALNNVELIEYLVKHKYSLDIPSLLHFCVDCNNENILNIILHNTRKLINEYDNDYVCTPLLRAVLNNNFLATEILLMYGGNPNIKNNSNYSALYYAIINRNPKMVEMLIDYDADVNNCIKGYKNGNSMLCIAMKYGNNKIIKLLESKKAIYESEY
jgi:ankyrin repeat protein